MRVFAKFSERLRSVSPFNIYLRRANGASDCETVPRFFCALDLGGRDTPSRGASFVVFLPYEREGREVAKSRSVALLSRNLEGMYI